MNKRDVPFEQWPAVFDQFSRAHHGKKARVTLIDPVAGTRCYSSDEPLLGLIDERHGEEDETLTVMLGAMPHGTSSHGVPRPQRVSIAEWNDNYSAELEIESSDGQRVSIQVGPAEQLLSPGMITDGILLEKPS